MPDNNKSLFPDIITPVSNAIHQNIPETEKQADGALSTVVGFFNNVVLYPVKKTNLTFRYKFRYCCHPAVTLLSDAADVSILAVFG